MTKLKPTTKLTIKDICDIMDVGKTTATRYKQDIKQHFRLRDDAPICMQHLQIYFCLDQNIYA